MKTYLLSLMVMFICAGPALGQENLAPDKKAAINAAENFLALVDAGQYPASWESASALFKSQVSKDTWVAQIARIRPIFGPVIQRKLKNAQHLTSAPRSEERRVG